MSNHRHDHSLPSDADSRYLVAALTLLAALMITEIITAVISGSLALLSDAGHMLSDIGAIAIALWAARLTRRRPQGSWTWGWKRAEIMSAAVNGVTLLVVAILVGIEAVRRLVTPPAVGGGLVMVIAAVGVVVNVAVAWLVARANRRSLNVEGAYQHILTDLFGFIGTLVAGLVIVMTGWTRADAIASLIICGLMLRAAWSLLSQTGRILMEVAPASLDLDEVRHHLMDLDHVRSVHDLHAWTVSSDLPALSAHIVVEDSCFADGHAPILLAQIQQCLSGHFDLDHSTLQLEPPRYAGTENQTM
ncbi:cation transporter [Propionibacterium sp. HMSC075A12]|uniref:Cation transporter n=1 Tax=Cutibacterium acnes TaxID=1747 RepID=A0AA44U560_CUTAC|nr:cation transporter [Cutibacterium acnes]OFJ81346.1 cation transporter [Propionibacterium sp. HMSC065F07]OFK52752.1 cation transporter [Propionibacterium sp. HMSC069G10]OFL46905.1 cation transporter [Propionibacterium sp. HMSC068C01]OFP50161.1 cation transporter [Propionibacterium sp. HMSC067A01]OFQ67134.1 cation transporter [Propionibacterium sp. HMSC075A12]PGF27935.1 cation transporter [Cutibacterium acnes subsp. defendens]